jgi:hypothetical protein
MVGSVPVMMMRLASIRLREKIRDIFNKESVRFKGVGDD